MTFYGVDRQQITLNRLKRQTYHNLVKLLKYLTTARLYTIRYRLQKIVAVSFSTSGETFNHPPNQNKIIRNTERNEMVRHGLRQSSHR